MFTLSLKDLKIEKIPLLLNTAFWAILSPTLLPISMGLFFLIITFGSLITGIIPLSTEIRNQTEILYVSLPIKRRTIVLSKYISSLVFALATFTFSVLWAAILDKYLPGLNINLSGSIFSIGLLPFLLIAVIIISIVIPIVIRFGFITSIIMSIFIIIMVTFGFILGTAYLVLPDRSLVNPGTIGTLLPQFFKIENLIQLIEQIMSHYGNTIPILITIAAIIPIIFLSIKISVKLFYRKEF